MNEPKKEKCDYCAKWYPEETMKRIFFAPRNIYCSRCYPEVYEEVKKLPWNRNKAPLS